jgi:hypothetical protein
MTSRNGESTIPITATGAPNLAGRLTPYARDDLRRLIAPRSVAIVGASDRKGSFGNRAMENLQSFDGQVHLVNARATSVAATRSRHVLLEPANVRFAPEAVLDAFLSDVRSTLTNRRGRTPTSGPRSANNGSGHA